MCVINICNAKKNEGPEYEVKSVLCVKKLSIFLWYIDARC